MKRSPCTIAGCGVHRYAARLRIPAAQFLGVCDWPPTPSLAAGGRGLLSFDDEARGLRGVLTVLASLPSSACWVEVSPPPPGQHALPKLAWSGTSQEPLMGTGVGRNPPLSRVCGPKNEIGTSLADRRFNVSYRRRAIALIPVFCNRDRVCSESIVEIVNQSVNQTREYGLMQGYTSRCRTIMKSLQDSAFLYATLPEYTKFSVLKIGSGASRSWVRIPPPPPMSPFCRESQRGGRELNERVEIDRRRNRD